MWKVVAKIMQFLSQAAARHASLGNEGGWKSVLKPAPVCAAVFIFRYLSFKDRQVVSILIALSRRLLWSIGLASLSVVCGRHFKWTGSEHF